MKSILRVVLLARPRRSWIIEPSTLACSPPPPETVALTWQPLAKITVIPDIDSINCGDDAMNNWILCDFLLLLCADFYCWTRNG